MTSPARPELCVGAVAVVDDHLLLVRRGTQPEAGRWSLPGGRVELGETIAEAVVREVREETGIDVVCDAFVGWVERIVDVEVHFVIMDFRVVVIGDTDVQASSDAADARWVPRWDVSEYDLVDGLLDFLVDHGLVDTL